MFIRTRRQASDRKFELRLTSWSCTDENWHDNFNTWFKAPCLMTLFSLRIWQVLGENRNRCRFRKQFWLNKVFVGPRKSEALPKRGWRSEVQSMQMRDTSKSREILKSIILLLNHRSLAKFDRHLLTLPRISLTSESYNTSTLFSIMVANRVARFPKTKNSGHLFLNECN